MSILDSFFFVLKADSKDAVQGINKAGEAFDDLKEEGKQSTETVGRNVTRMGQLTQSAGNVASRALGGIEDNLRGLILPAGAAVAALGSVAAAWERIQGFVSTANNAQSLNIPVEEYDAYAKVLQSAGYEADETRDLFVDLAEAIGEGASDAESQRAKTFKELGVSLKDANGNMINATQGFEGLSKAIDGMSPEKAIFLIRQLGINDPKLLTLLTKGNQALQERLELVRRNGVMTAEQAKAAQELQNEQQKLSLVLSGIGESIARGVLPYVAGFFKALNAIIDYVNQHKVAFATFFAIPATVIATALIPSIVQATLATGRLAVATLAATWPWVALAAAVAAVALVAEDVYLYFTDPTASTVTGELVKKFPELGKVLEEVRGQIIWMRDAFLEVKDQALQTFDDVVNYINSLNPALDKLVANAKTAFTGLFNWFRSLGLEIGDFFRDLFAGIVNSIVDSVPEAAQKALGISRMRTGAERRLGVQAGDLAGDVAAATGVPPSVPVTKQEPDGILPNSSSAPGAAKAVMAAAAASPINSVAGSSSSVSTRVVETHAPVHIDRMEIHTQSSDPAAINEAVTGGIGEQWKNTVAQHDDGISH